jgi:CNT family concentrative nucleoside transporter
MVFGYLGGGDLPFDEPHPGASFILAFNALPIILVVSALSSLFFYWRILPFIIHLISRLLQKSLNIGGAEGVGLAANIFIGMVESPLLIRPFISRLTRSELFSVMTCGMATVAGTVIVLYASILSSAVPDVLGHILVASVMSVPAAYVISKIMIPETEPVTLGELEPDEGVTSAFQAITEGTINGVRLLVYIVAMLVVMVALVELVNIILSLLPATGGEALTLQRILGYLFAPVAWLMGIPWQESAIAGTLLGTKTIINEFVAYLSLADVPEGALSNSSTLILTYALCGFANPGSLGIMIGGLTAIAPERKTEIVELCVKSLISGTLATCMTGAVAGLFL